MSSNNAWIWGPGQTDGFNKVKDELTSHPVLTWAAETKLTADASAYGLRVGLLQKNETTWKLVTCASRSMIETKTRYAQIENGALATTWARECFTDYILGK